VLRGSWIRPEGLVKKTSAVTAGLIGLLAIALKAIINGENSLRRVSQCWN